jgi:phospholipase D-like protein
MRAIEDFQERFSPRQRAAILTLAATELALKVAAARDIARRPAAQVRGPKVLWRMALLVNTFGPLGYFAWGRRPQPH